MLTDPLGRTISYLRISVTDRCNLRCVYCMPPQGIPLSSHDTIMRYEEILEVVKIAAEQGITAIRLTGGEPLARMGITELVRMIASVPGIHDISMTTNGLLLERFAQELKEAGLKRINISLDTLKPDRFSRITRGGSFEQVWRGILAAEKAGLNPIKLNTVVMRGVNDDELSDLASLTLEHPWHVRFIEMMPVNNQEAWDDGFPPINQIFVALSEIKQRLAVLNLKPVQEKSGNGPARVFSIEGGQGKIGFISPISEHFCGECNRLRLTADGNLRPCLLSDLEIPLLPALRKGENILPLLQQAVQLKPEGHTLQQNQRTFTRCMIQIGG